MNLRVVCGVLPMMLGLAQTPTPRLEFEVASIKPSEPGKERASIGSRGPGRFDAENIPVQSFIARAYQVETFQIYGAPGWVASEEYDVSAKAEIGPEKKSAEDSSADMRLRLKSLLEDRCALKVHRETRELAVYALTVVKSGIKVKPPNCVTFDMNNRPPPPEPGQPRPVYCQSYRTGRNGANSTFNGTGIAMTALVRWLANTVERTVIDKTGYTEPFDAAMEWGTDMSDSTGPSIFTALQEQLGLRLESTKGAVEVLVIDHVERPSAN